jgi:hypothetical protein
MTKVWYLIAGMSSEEVCGVIRRRRDPNQRNRDGDGDELELHRLGIDQDSLTTMHNNGGQRMPERTTQLGRYQRYGGSRWKPLLTRIVSEAQKRRSRDESDSRSRRIDMNQT